MKNIVILGSTGSIGKQAVEVVLRENYRIKGLTAAKNSKLLESQARLFKPELVALRDEAAAADLKIRLKDTNVKVLSGEEGVLEVASLKCDITLNSIVGIAGLLPTLKAIEAGNDIALANKETLVTGGVIVNKKAKEKGVKILPVDSEHSAIFQSLQGAPEKSLKKILLTCSGGPFFDKTRAELDNVTAKDALKHPNWDMGAKITIDSATMMNKGFEVIEAKWLFGVRPDQIEVVVHPQSVIHSMVQYEDGAVKAQLGVPDMRLPIQYAFSYPQRIKASFDRLDFSQMKALTFEQPDTDRFRCLALAYEALNRGGNMACIVNAANEVVVSAFLHDRISFLQMSEVIEQTMGKVTFIQTPSYEDYVETDAEARRVALDLIK